LKVPLRGTFKNLSVPFKASISCKAEKEVAHAARAPLLFGLYGFFYRATYQNRRRGATGVNLRGEIWIG